MAHEAWRSVRDSETTHGNRFANELEREGLRDGRDVAGNITLDVWNFYESGATPVQDMGMPVSRLVESIEAHCQATLKMDQVSVGGLLPAYPSGKSWDEASGKTGSGKSFYHNVISEADFAAQPSCVEIIAPVIHYRMGSLEIDEDSAVKGLGLKPVPDFCVTEEVVGGVQDNKRLGDNSLLDHAVFGRVTGGACARNVLSDGVKVTSLAVLANEGRGERSKSDQAIVVGGDWADSSAPNTVFRNIGSVVLLDKSSFYDLRSTVERSMNGMNGAS